MKSLDHLTGWALDGAGTLAGLTRLVDESDEELRNRVTRLWHETTKRSDPVILNVQTKDPDRFLDDMTRIMTDSIRLKTVLQETHHDVEIKAAPDYRRIEVNNQDRDRTPEYVTYLVREADRIDWSRQLRAMVEWSDAKRDVVEKRSLGWDPHPEID